MPYTTIFAALANISSPANNCDHHLGDKFIIYVSQGQYNESLTVPGFRHMPFISDGLVLLGSTTHNI